MRSPPSREETCLPRYLTSFVGRQDEIAEITTFLARDDVRLLTLTGPGGAGKTRLAVETVARLDASTCEGIWFVPLVAVRDPALVLPAIAQTLGLHQVSGRPVADTITHFLHGRRALLLIDNFELVTDAAPGLGQVLSACPGTTMLVTSRVALRISGEHLMTIKPLDTPGSTDTPLDELRGIASVQLFLQRANSSGRKLALTDDTARDLAGICRRLDGLPLALELAAARTGLLSPSALLKLLRQGSGILSDGPADAHERHRSMHDAIAWSYDLLPERERAVFRRLSVFSGGFSLEAAEAVVDLPVDMLATIASLAGQSLVVPVQGDSFEPRFTMLETLREFGLEQLTAKGEEQQVRDRHASFFLREAIDGEYAWCMYLADGLPLLNRLVADQANMREALGWLDASGDILRCIRLAGALGSLWVVCGNLHEGHEWLDRLLRDPRATDGPERVNALATLSWVSQHQGGPTRALALAEEAVALAQTFGLPMDIARSYILSGVAASKIHKHELALRRHQQAIAHLSSLEDPPWGQNLVLIELAQLGFVELMRGHIDEAEVHFTAAYDHDLQRGFEPGTSHVYGNQVFNGLAHVARARGNLVGALDLFQHVLRLALRYANTNFAIHAMCDIAGTLAALGSYRTAAQLFGATQTLHETYGYEFSDTFNLQRAFGLPEPWAREEESCGSAEMLRHALSPRTIPQLPGTIAIGTLNRIWDEGRSLSFDAAVSEALEASADSPLDTADIHSSGLSSRQLDVLRLIADGCSNRAIADALSLSERTVEHHVSHILNKLDLDSRTAAATFAVRQGLL